MTRISFSHWLMSGLLAGAAAVAVAQPAPSPSPSSAPATQAGESAARKPMPRHDPAKFQAKMAERQSALKAQLKITAEQESAWSTYTASMRPATDGARPARPDALRTLTTPERITLMRAHQAQRQAAMERRADATLSLYAALSPEQQKLFDERTARAAEPGRRGHGPGPRAHAPAPVRN